MEKSDTAVPDSPTVAKHKLIENYRANAPDSAITRIVSAADFYRPTAKSMEDARTTAEHIADQFDKAARQVHEAMGEMSLPGFESKQDPEKQRELYAMIQERVRYLTEQLKEQGVNLERVLERSDAAAPAVEKLKRAGLVRN